jgi:hypothetical protein
MPGYWTCHWQYRFWRDDVNTEFEPIGRSGSNSFRKRGVSPGDTVYVISVNGGQLYLGGRMVVGRIVDRTEAVRISGNENLYDAAEWVINEERSGSPLNLHRRLAPELTRQITCIVADGSERGLFFSTETHLDSQTTRGIRRLTPESAQLLDRIVGLTDAMPRADELVTVNSEMLNINQIDAR